MGLGNKGRAQILRKFAAIPHAERSRGSISSCGGGNRAYISFSTNNPQRLNGVEIRPLWTQREMFHFIIINIKPGLNTASRLNKAAVRNIEPSLGN